MINSDSCHNYSNKMIQDRNNILNIHHGIQEFNNKTKYLFVAQENVNLLIGNV